MKFENLIKELDALKRDRWALPDVFVENDKEHDDVFLITWRYPVESVIPITDNFISLTYRFKMDIQELEKIWREKNQKEPPDIKDLFKVYFIDVCKYLKDFNGAGDDYEEIFKVLDGKRGDKLGKDFGFT